MGDIPLAVPANFWPQCGGDPSSEVGFIVISEWGFSHQQSDKLGSYLSGEDPNRRVRTLSEGHSHNAGF